MARVPISRRLLRVSNREKIVELRLAGQPFRVVAANVGCSEEHARRLFAEYYHKNVGTSHVTQQLRKNERRDQLEVLDGLLMRLMMEAANPATRKAGAYTVRDFLGAAEASRRVKADLTKLDGLEGANTGPPPSPDGSPSPEIAGSEERRSLWVMRFIEGCEGRHPDLYAAFMKAFGKASPATVGAEEETDDRSGSDPGRDADADIDPSAAAPPSDP